MMAANSGPNGEIAIPYSDDERLSPGRATFFKELFSQPSVFLSASVADPRRSSEYRSPRRPAHLIRDAVIQLCHLVFARNWNLVFGGHPAISPMVLAVARDRVPKSRKPVIVFQSEFFKDVIPKETIQLWQYGVLLLTPSRSDKPTSLAEMRRLMLTVPNLRCAVFLGGMKGVTEESDVFHQHNPHSPRFAFGSTGSAAADLLHEDPTSHSGDTVSLRYVLDNDRAYAVVLRRIFSRPDLKP